MEREQKEIPLLVAQSGQLAGQRWQLKHRMLIGRDSTCDIVIPDRQISRHHARITPTPSGVILEDLGSKNGTHRNGRRVDETVILQDGDDVQIAYAQQFTYICSDATLPLDSEITDYQPIVTGALHIEKRSRRVWVGDDEVVPPLSVSQYKLLEVLYENQGKVVSRFNIIETVWGKEQAVVVSEQALDALVRRLRERLAKVDPQHNYIVTVRGHGLRLDNPPTE
ncbi:MAG: FHA domain-containing protein [Anaerolineales bacterium]|jgi:DNA-binding winged helix-turn-helix (wHTH) protein